MKRLFNKSGALNADAAVSLQARERRHFPQVPVVDSLELCIVQVIISVKNPNVMYEKIEAREASRV